MTTTAAGYAPSGAAATVGDVGEAEPPAGSTVMATAAAEEMPFTTAGLDSASASMGPAEPEQSRPWESGHIW